jgi:formylglycine-generating enzyme required for sulfatase activity
MKKWNRALRAFSPAAVAVIIAAGFVLTGCKNEVTEKKDVAVTGVTLLADDGRSLDGFSMAVGQNEILAFTVLPVKATDKTIIWSSSDTDVAIVSEGIVYAVGEGDATITATTRSGNKTATCTVTVTKSIAVTGVELDKNILFLVVGGIPGHLTHTLYPANATNKEITWLSYNPAVATVDKDGKVTGVASGAATITVTTEDGKFDASCTVTVVKDAPEAPGMVWINPGTFMMGSPLDEPESRDNEILHQVTLTEGFYMGKYPVTQKQYLAVMGENWSSFPNDTNRMYANRWEEFPAETMNWYEAIIFCNKLSMNEGLRPVYTMYKVSAPNADNPAAANNTANWNDAANWSTDPDDWGDIGTLNNEKIRWDCVRMIPFSNGYRLPTEAQWEYACRAGTTTPFNTGDNITTDQANWLGNYPYNNGDVRDPNGVYLGQTVPAGMYDAPNAWGLHDMHGNVSEWCWDWHGSYNRGVTLADTDPKGPDTGFFRVIRGGAYWDEATYLRSAYREGYNPLAWAQNIGFRVVRSYSAPAVIGE